MIFLFEHALSPDSNPQAARISAVRQKIKNDAIQSLTKPTNGPNDDSKHVLSDNFQIVIEAVSTADESKKLLVGTQRALKQVIHVSSVV